MKDRLTPEIKTVATQLPVNNIDCPRSGWSINKNNYGTQKYKTQKYLIWIYLNCPWVRIFTVIKIKKGFKISIGCKLKKYKFSQRLAPLTSTPIIGTIANKIKEIKKIGNTNLINNSVLINEIVSIIEIANNVKNKCLVKKK